VTHERCNAVEQSVVHALNFVVAERLSSAAWAQGWSFHVRGALRAHVSCNDSLACGHSDRVIRNTTYRLAQRRRSPRLRVVPYEQ
jgi:hypothetical protein